MQQETNDTITKARESAESIIAAAEARSAELNEAAEKKLEEAVDKSNGASQAAAAAEAERNRNATLAKELASKKATLDGAVEALEKDRAAFQARVKQLADAGVKIT